MQRFDQFQCVIVSIFQNSLENNYYSYNNRIFPEIKYLRTAKLSITIFVPFLADQWTLEEYYFRHFQGLYLKVHFHISCEEQNFLILPYVTDLLDESTFVSFQLPGTNNQNICYDNNMHML